MDRDSEEKAPPPRQDPHPVEWVIAAISSVMVLFVVGLLIYDGLKRGDDGPILEVRVEKVVPTGAHYRVDFVVSNSGDATAANATVAATLRDAEGTIAEAEVTLDYVPERSERRGGLILDEDPAGHVLELRPTGFTEP